MQAADTAEAGKTGGRAPKNTGYGESDVDWPFGIILWENWFSEYASMVSFNVFLTLVTELPLAFLLGVRGRKNFNVMLIVNCISNPLLITLVFPLIWFYGYGIWMYAVVIPLEAVVIFAEGAAYRKKLKNDTAETASDGRERIPMNPFLLSFLLNVVSYGIGEILNLIGTAG